MNEQRIATFSDLRFSQGTRLKTVKLQFTQNVECQQLEGPSVKTVLESDPSQPFIVLTNENQWDVSEGILTQRDAFGNLIETTWPSFANVLQTHYIHATRQDPGKPIRCLSAEDIRYIHEVKFDTKPLITQRDFEKFWEWFGKVLHKIRHSRQLTTLWLKGLIYGFISKEGAEDLLKNKEVGTFLIRFSERIAGQFTIAYVKLNSVQPGQNNPQREVTHYLLKQDDMAGPNKTLADFIKVHGHFIYILEKKLDFEPQGLIKGGFEKHQVFEEFYTKKTAAIVDGYEEDLED